MNKLINRIKEWVRDRLLMDEPPVTWTNGKDEAFEIMNQWTQNQLNDYDTVEDELI